MPQPLRCHALVKSDRSNLEHFVDAPNETLGGRVRRGRGEIMRILIVEDEVLIRMLVRDLLEDAGFECRDAGDAADAAEILDDKGGWQPDLLVTDYNLGPGPNGVAVATEARRRSPGLPVVYATGNPECLAGQLLGVRERVVVKPFTSDELVEAVHDLGQPVGPWAEPRQQVVAASL
ncbi:response regulator [Belnapia sp. T6]|uniref:Response regulator n=1 Tax=Belnapia mucosa TaxID=2804532 RepID=A0ABS1V274_9PROT|nr:response regulator [Belnapia mucosa]MBL6455804.1 response regulator [Belnapia mucosa]